MRIKSKFLAVLQIRIRMFLGLLDPDPSVSGTDPAPDPFFNSALKTSCYIESLLLLMHAFSAGVW